MMSGRNDRPQRPTREKRAPGRLTELPSTRQPTATKPAASRKRARAASMPIVDAVKDAANATSLPTASKKGKGEASNAKLAAMPPSLLLKAGFTAKMAAVAKEPELLGEPDVEDVPLLSAKSVGQLGASIIRHWRCEVASCVNRSGSISGACWRSGKLHFKLTSDVIAGWCSKAVEGSGVDEENPPSSVVLVLGQRGPAGTSTSRKSGGPSGPNQTEATPASGSIINFYGSAAAQQPSSASQSFVSTIEAQPSPSLNLPILPSSPIQTREREKLLLKFLEWKAHREIELATQILDCY